MSATDSLHSKADTVACKLHHSSKVNVITRRFSELFFIFRNKFLDLFISKVNLSAMNHNTSRSTSRLSASYASARALTLKAVSEQSGISIAGALQARTQPKHHRARHPLSARPRLRALCDRSPELWPSPARHSSNKPSTTPPGPLTSRSLRFKGIACFRATAKAGDSSEQTGSPRRRV